jgi:SAM-dependent methyltransferase
VFENRSQRETLKKLLNSVGFDTTDWVRVVLYQKSFEFLRSLGPENLEALEISAGPQWKRAINFKSYEATNFPDFDICSETLPRQFDIIIADQIFEHLAWPYRAGRNIHHMLRPGGYLIIAVPFLLRVHKSPTDCSRWTEEGLSYLLQECGFSADDIVTDSWGNKACVKANLTSWKRFGWHRSLHNEPDFPVMVWAFARKSTELHDSAASTDPASNAASGPRS